MPHRIYNAVQKPSVLCFSSFLAAIACEQCLPVAGAQFPSALVWSLSRQRKRLMCESLKQFDGTAPASLRGWGSAGAGGAAGSLARRQFPAHPGRRAHGPTLPPLSPVPFCCRAPGAAARLAWLPPAGRAASPAPPPDGAGRGRSRWRRGAARRRPGPAVAAMGRREERRWPRRLALLALLWLHARGERGGRPPGRAGFGKVAADGARREGFWLRTPILVLSGCSG